MDTLKKDIISRFSCLPLLEGMEKNKLVLATPSGIITGTPVRDYKAYDNSTFITFVDSVINEYRTKHNIPNGERLDGNDGCILLTDVTVQNGSLTTQLPIICVFYDQIVGVSIGNITN